MIHKITSTILMVFVLVLTSIKNYVNCDMNITAFFEAHQTDNNFLIVTMANKGHLQFVLNLVESMSRNINNYNKFVVICLDDELYEVLINRNIVALPISAIIKDPHIVDIYKNKKLLSELVFNTGMYNRMTNMKLEIVLELITTYKQRVIFTDDDVVWINPKIIEYIHHTLHTDGYDVVFSLDRWNVKHYVNTGLYAINPTDFAITLFKDSISKASEANDQYNVQQTINKLSPEMSNKIGYLPMLFFQNGEGIKTKLNDYYNVRPWTVHANFVAGTESKKRMLEGAGFWYINSSMY